MLVSVDTVVIEQSKMTVILILSANTPYINDRVIWIGCASGINNRINVLFDCSWPLDIVT